MESSSVSDACIFILLLTRVQPLIDHARRVSQDCFQPNEKIAVDERMIRSKHKLSGIRQIMKDKPVKFGIKL